MKPNIWIHSDSVDKIIARTRYFTKQYFNLGIKFGTKFGNVAKLYIIRYLEMYLTNEPERIIRKVMIHRKNLQRLVTNSEMRTFEVIMMCTLM